VENIGNAKLLLDYQINHLKVHTLPHGTFDRLVTHCPSLKSWKSWESKDNARRHLANTIELVLPSADQSPQPKGHLDRLSCLCRAHDCDRQTMLLHL